VTNRAGKPRWRQLKDQLTSEIRSGSRSPGSKLPSVAEQTKAGYSATTTMRAYRELVAQGLAATVQGAGTYVADPPPDSPGQPSLEELAARIDKLELQMATLLSRQ
jgi:DNA-binding GntR family transcriptional regulator